MKGFEEKSTTMDKDVMSFVYPASVKTTKRLDEDEYRLFQSAQASMFSYFLVSVVLTLISFVPLHESLQGASYENVGWALFRMSTVVPTWILTWKEYWRHQQFARGEVVITKPVSANMCLVYGAFRFQ